MSVPTAFPKFTFLRALHMRSKANSKFQIFQSFSANVKPLENEEHFETKICINVDVA